jgi:hypothetical protein
MSVEIDMSAADDPKPGPSSAGQGGRPEETEGDVPNAGPVSDPAGRDFGDSAGYGSGGSTHDYQDVVGENPVTENRPNPLDEVIPTEPECGRNDGHPGPERKGA